MLRSTDAAAVASEWGVSPHREVVRVDLWSVNEREKLALVRDLAGVSDAAWDAPSLCAEMRIRDVVGHLVSGATVRKSEWFGGIARSGFNFNRFIVRSARQQGDAEPAALLRSLETTASSHHLPPFATPVSMLGETICHAQDIRRPLRLDHHCPAGEELEAVADWFKGQGYPFGAKKRIAGVRLTATDAAWATGEGPEASGILEALVMVMAGRRAAVADLTGPAAAMLESRFASDAT
jgi:uncharacterized protein (TIGR03083 family)